MAGGEDEDISAMPLAALYVCGVVPEARADDGDWPEEVQISANQLEETLEVIQQSEAG